MSWNKFNLYNLAHRALPPQTSRKTLFQQRWEAKRLTRGYHGDHLTERQWQRLFNAGGRATSSTLPSLTFAALERRLEVAVFRCLFAPSVMAAHQMIRHGAVQVNEKKMLYPSYRLKDGDMITVDPDAIPMLKRGESPKEPHTYTPRDYSQPFHFLPDYLEVDYATCSAVFLREPVARPGRSEIPSPYPPHTHQLAYEFYVRKRG
ncbi:hypothetical protein SYNPS1DRAFT_32824 [Syncephalis pseudoplumigaleata]|uniref:RNA-binding S4 domain-containing protein n=1 Tax=Syncephalis pseudoplumigaleata TaxID=1712513 RepID=A0A4P9Z2B9_9FUNG|nr:hypothetical protein SYNPS1DRAFT_32824 [Syncephalis pseudoplumigaleata]|eukprot:RKP26112.1 hypothetical protein SYNPS1DRAFT_32824 [Syncephalis pseudoplumigaleata]